MMSRIIVNNFFITSPDISNLRLPEKLSKFGIKGLTSLFIPNTQFRQRSLVVFHIVI